MVEKRYYPAYLLNTDTYDDATSCLLARGCSEEQAQEFITMAEIHQCEIVLQSNESEPDDFFLVIAKDEGKWRTWAARGRLIRDTREKATALTKTLSNDVEWRVFDLPRHDSLRSMN